ncbi:unnamed protein product [Ilex paraguariensis]|uniref:Uncharacterized protein n=1 Tax=Ilex paraguariensis TaxID=185542 RepID=A0ABC8RPL1_9AQUA
MTKVDELVPHPVKEQLPGVDFCVNSNPSWLEAIILGFQHYLVMLGTLVIIARVIVPQMGGGNAEKAQVVQTLLFVAGINTLLQTWFLSPLSAVPLVTLVGLGLYTNGFPLLAECVEVGLPELIILIFLSQYIPHMWKTKRPIIDRFAVVLSVGIVWAYAALLTAAGAYKNRPASTQFSCRVDRSGLVSGASWIKVPYPFQWGQPNVGAGDAFVMMAAALVALIESTGAFIAAARFGSATHVPSSVLSRGVGWLGVSLLLDGLWGTGSGSTVSV